MAIQQDQIYRINSFHLGFINVYPADVLLKVDEVDYARDILLLSILHFTDDASNRTLCLIDRWFQTVYPTLDKTTCLLKNLQHFQALMSSPNAGAQLLPELYIRNRHAS